MNKSIIIGLFLLANGQISHGMEHKQYKPELTPVEAVATKIQLTAAGIGAIAGAYFIIKAVPLIISDLPHMFELCDKRDQEVIDYDAKYNNKEGAKAGKGLAIFVMSALVILGVEGAKRLAMWYVCSARDTFNAVKTTYAELLDFANQLRQNSQSSEDWLRLLALARELGHDDRHDDSKDLHRAVAKIQDLINNLNVIEKDKEYYIKQQAYDSHIPEWIYLLKFTINCIQADNAYEQEYAQERAQEAAEKEAVAANRRRAELGLAN